MEKNIFIFLVIVSCVTVALAKGRFYTYNNEERQKFENSLNEVNSHVFHEKETINYKQSKMVKSGTPKWDPTWESIDSRPLPAWYDQSKIGIFVHWGVYSVPGVESEWFWKTWTDGREECVNYMNDNFKPNFTYQEFAPKFTAEFYDPNAWANLFSRSGARYVVLTSKHHEGYTLWPSLYSYSWNAQDVGPHRDVLGALANAIRTNTTLKFGLYHSLYEWYNPLWMNDKSNGLNTSDFVNFKIFPEMYEIVNKYRPEIFWSDGEWEAPDTYWKSKEFIAWLYNDSPVKDTVVTNDRWGHDTLCTHGGYYTCADRYNPGVLQPHKWENCLTLDIESWGFRRNARIEDYLTPEELITTIIESVSCNGNVLVNVGPTREGMIAPIQEERLLQMGEWLNINGEAIYETVPYKVQNDTVTPGVWFTYSADQTKVYVMMTNWPGQTLHVGAINTTLSMTISMLGSTGNLSWTAANPGFVVTLPRPDLNSSKWAWTLVLSNL